VPHSCEATSGDLLWQWLTPKLLFKIVVNHNVVDCELAARRIHDNPGFLSSHAKSRDNIKVTNSVVEFDCFPAADPAALLAIKYISDPHVVGWNIVRQANSESRCACLRLLPHADYCRECDQSCNQPQHHKSYFL